MPLYHLDCLPEVLKAHLHHLEVVGAPAVLESDWLIA
jgi:hypothetical protein